MVGFFRLLGGELGGGSEVFSLVFPLVDVSVIIQLMFLQYFENVDVPQFPSSTECYSFQLFYRGVYVQCKLCISRRFHNAVLGQVVHAPVVMQRQVLLLVETVQKTVRFRLAFSDLVHCPSLCNDKCRMVETVQPTVESPQLVLLLVKVVDVPVLTSHGAVEVPQLQFIDWCFSSSWLW